jgi:hypothetical protein
MELLHADKFGHWFLFQNNYTLYFCCDFWTEYADGQVFFILSARESEAYFTDEISFIHKLAEEIKQNPGGVQDPGSYTWRSRKDNDTYALGGLLNQGSQLAAAWCKANNTEEAERIHYAQMSAEQDKKADAARAEEAHRVAERVRKEQEAIENRRAWELMPSGDVQNKPLSQ